MKVERETLAQTAARQARALWYVAPGVAELRSAPLAAPASGEALIRTLWSGISRGTERLVFNGLHDPGHRERMRAPLQEGDFPFPVKYGYCAVGRVEQGPSQLVDRTVFCLHPHQDRFVARTDALFPVPDGVPPRRATLAANMETALNAIWDSGAGPGDRIVVVGAGVVGLLVASIAARLPGAEVTVLDTDDSRRAMAGQIGAGFETADRAPKDADIVFHASASAEGFATALSCCGVEAAVVELSWYGDASVSARLGGVFHSKRLKIVASQVGAVSPTRRARWDFARRLMKAIELLSDDSLDALVQEEVSFRDLPAALPGILAPRAAGLAPVVRYDEGVR